MITGEIEVNEVKITKDDRFSFCDLTKEVDFSTPFTFGDFLHFLMKMDESDLFNLFGVDLCPFYNELGRIKRKNKEDNVVLKTIVVSWVGEKNEDGNTNHWSVYALTENDTQNYAIDFSPMWELKDCLITVDKQMRFTDWTKSPPEMKSVDFQPQINLFDLAFAIIYEISWHGSPRSRDNRMKELKRRIKEVESGKAKLIPAEEVFANIRAKFGSEKGKKQ